MSRGHTPFGYRIENGVVVVREDQAEKIRKMYAGYLSGLSLRNAAKEAGVIAMHASVKGLLQNLACWVTASIRRSLTEILLTPLRQNAGAGRKRWAGTKGRKNSGASSRAHILQDGTSVGDLR